MECQRLDLFGKVSGGWGWRLRGGGGDDDDGCEDGDAVVWWCGAATA
jgi:hypothetical protein